MVTDANRDDAPSGPLDIGFGGIISNVSETGSGPEAGGVGDVTSRLAYPVIEFNLGYLVLVDGEPQSRRCTCVA